MDNRGFKMHTTVHSVIYEIVLMFNIRKPNFTTYIIVLLNYLLQGDKLYVLQSYLIIAVSPLIWRRWSNSNRHTATADGYS